MELTRKTKNIIEKEYAEELRTAKVGYFRNMTSARKQRLYELVQSENEGYNICLACSSGVLKMLTDINNSTLKYVNKTKNKNKNTQEDEK